MFKDKTDKNFLIFSIFFLVIFVIISIYYFIRIYQPWGTCWTDFTVFHRAGQRIVKGELIYNLADGLDVYKYSPAFAFFMALFTKMHMHKSVPLWYLLSFIGILSSVYFIKEIILRSEKQKSLPKYFYFVLFFLTFRSILVLLSRVQSDFLVLFFLTLCIWLIFLKKEALGGLALAWAIMVKLTPLIFIPYFLYRRLYKTVFFCTISMLAYLLLPAINLGWDKNIGYLKDWFNTLAVSTPELVLWYKNQSLLSCISRLFSQGSPVKLFVLPPLAIKGIFALVSFFMVLLIIYSCRKLIAAEGRLFGYGHLLEFSLLLICMVLFSPLAWKHTFLHLLVAHMAVVYYLVKHRRDFVVLTLLVTSFILNSVLNPEVLQSLDEIASLYSPMVIGALLLYAALLMVAYRLRGVSYAE